MLLPVADVHPRLDLHLARDLPRLGVRLLVPLLLLAPVMVFDLFERLAVEWLRILPAAGGAVLLARLLTYRLVRGLRTAGRIVEPALVVGAGELALRLATSLREHAEHGLEPIGSPFLVSPLDPQAQSAQLDDFDRAVAQLGVTRIIVACGADDAGVVRVVRRCRCLDVEVYVVPRLFELEAAAGATGGAGGTHADEVWGTPLRRLPRRALRSPGWRTKRVLDVAVASVLLVLTAPLQLLLALAVRLQLGRPILFRQPRVGVSGRLFEIVKFRTLPVSESSDVTWAVTGETSVSWLGRQLRRTGLDELPQLLNVIRGDMSLVGPRPERPFFSDEFAATIPGYGDRLRVPGGITGWAQVNGLVGDTSITDRTRFDNSYIESWSPWLDLLILARTVTEGLKGGPIR